MKNYEKYAEQIKNYKNDGELTCGEILRQNVLKPLGVNCNEVSCYYCIMLTTLWLLEECEEPKVDWSKVEVDTPILIRDSEDEGWGKRYFAKYEDGLVYSWTNGTTGWVLDYDSSCMTHWKYAKLAETEGEEW